MLLLYGVFEKLVLPDLACWLNLGCYSHVGGDLRSWRPDVEALFQGFVAFPLFFAFYLWIGADISRVFKSLKTNGSFSNERRFNAFTRLARRSFARGEYWLVGVGAAVIVTVAVNLDLWDGTPPRVWWQDLPDHIIKPEPFWSVPRVFSWVLIPMLVYAVSQVLIREGLAIRWWRRMWRELDELVLHPYHPDGAAGLGAFGQHAVGISYFLLVATLCVFVGSLLPSLRYGNKVIFATTDTVTVDSSQMVPRPRGTRTPQFGWREVKPKAGSSVRVGMTHLPDGQPRLKFAPRRMAMADAHVLHIRILRLHGQAIAMDEWFPIDSPAGVPARSVPGKFHWVCRGPTTRPSLSATAFHGLLESRKACPDSELVLAHQMGRVETPPLVRMQADSERFAVSLEGTSFTGVYPTLRIFGIPLSLWNPLLLVQWILLLVVLCLSLGPLLWPAHAAMEQWLYKELNRLSKSLDRYVEIANRTRSKDPDMFDRASAAIARIKQMRTALLEDCETWPISAALRKRLGISSGISISSSVVNVVAGGGMNLLRQLT